MSAPEMPTPPEPNPYEVVAPSSARPPRLPGRIILRPTADEAYDAVLADLFMQAMSCIGAFGDFHFAVSPSPALEIPLRRMLFDLSLRSFPWQKTRLWLTNEVGLPQADDSRRGVALYDLLGSQSGIPEEQIHLIEGWREDADEAYEKVLRDVLGWREKGHDRLDAVLAAIGADGSIAGLAPGSSVLSTVDRLVVRDRTGGSLTEVAMSLPLLNASRVVAIVATGPEVQPMLRTIAALHREGTAGSSDIPAARLLPTGGELRWYLDQESLSVAPGAE